MCIDASMIDRPTARRFGHAWIAAAALVFVPTANVQADAGILADDAFATSLFGDDARTLWPLDVAFELVRWSPEDGQWRTLQHDAVTVRSGELTSFAHADRRPTGERTTTVAVVGRHHPGGVVELEYDVRVIEARYQAIGVGEYVMHRLGLGASPVLGVGALRVSRADIVPVGEASHRERFELDGDRYEIRLFAASTRG